MSSILKLNAIKTSARCFVKNTVAALVNRGFASTHSVYFNPSIHNETDSATVVFRNSHAQNLKHEPISSAHCAQSLLQNAQSTNWSPSVSSVSSEVFSHGSVRQE